MSGPVGVPPPELTPERCHWSAGSQTRRTASSGSSLTSGSVFSAACPSPGPDKSITIITQPGSFTQNYVTAL